MKSSWRTGVSPGLPTAEYSAAEQVIERAMILHVEAFDWNCPQHITPRYEIEEIIRINHPLYEHAEKLEAEIERRKGARNEN